MTRILWIASWHANSAMKASEDFFAILAVRLPRVNFTYFP
jgi:hypothetical protein